MFTGIIEQLGTITAIENKDTNVTLTVKTPITHELKVDQSVSHSGVCLTVESISDDTYTVTAIAETLLKTNISQWKVGTVVNIERCLRFDGRLDGHIVQGHVDTVGKCTGYTAKNGSWEYVITIDEKFAPLIIEKGSISLNGISLTIFNVTKNSFTVAIIPFTYEHTNMHQLQLNDQVNIEFDMIGKYVNRMNSLK
ncbi:riboflavin synthase [Ferruginibacter yonginensis]|uniref:Riboflavin synthase n=1 Tax=Ferruginibacter yonginensis TaxID=1310416 RepID=A0ABV8QSS7_9BACT